MADRSIGAPALRPLPAARLAAIDRSGRATALDSTRSVIVQAPAGSGKTELLTRRILALLATADAPEEIVAITFTRKAAAEMRNRVLGALCAAQGPKPASEHEAQTWKLARRALARDRERGWNLARHPARLAVQTFDALCASLARQLPVTSRLGALPAVVDQSRSLYRAAAARTLAAGSTDMALQTAWSALLEHLDNDVAAVLALIGELLPRREQWLPLLARSDDLDAWRRELEAELVADITRLLGQARAGLPEAEAAELRRLADFAAAHCADRDRAQALARLAAMPGLPGCTPADAADWQSLVDWLLTGAGEFRRKLDAGCGFPSASNAGAALRARFRERKQAMERVLARLRSNPRLAPMLHRLRTLPAAAYRDSQWSVVSALLTLLRHAAAELEVLFAEQGTSDFAGVAMAAQRAIGDERSPSDLLQALDYRLRHVLVDEFQDTSRAQFRLLETLLAGWESGDGRTLFLVGDPMQSIYRFRQAEVALFSRAKATGVGPVAAQSVQLAFNFRSVPTIVNWVNETFAPVFASVPRASLDPVHYAPATAEKAGDGEVQFHLEADSSAEAARVVSLVREARDADPTATVAVLVRGRVHLAEVAPALRSAGVAYQAVEIDSLRERQAVLDLLSLAQALRHPADRHAWLALLRGPLVGLTLPELLTLAPDLYGKLLAQPGAHDRLDPLAADTRRRVARFAEVMRQAIDARARQPLCRRVEAAWLALGGPAALDDRSDLVAVGQFLSELRAFETAEGVADWQAFREQVAQLWAPADPAAGDAVQLLTIHKAKGLQFDTVIVPGITRAISRSAQALLRWRVGPTGGLLLAPINPRDDRSEPIHAHLAALEADDDEAELGRLLYVAATRAKRSLHWVGTVNDAQRARKGGYRPPGGTLLARLWPGVAPHIRLPEVDARPAESVALRVSVAQPVGVRPAPLLRRLPAQWMAPPLPPDVAAVSPRTSVGPDLLPFDWARELARCIGVVAHRYLLQIARDGLAQWPPDRIDAAGDAIAVRLRALGVVPPDLEHARERVLATLRRSVADPRGRWLLDGAQGDACSELAVTAVLDGEVVHIVVDRTFVANDGTRWVVDFKTGMHQGADLDAFLDSELERYRGQLERYARVLGALHAPGAGPVRLGLYYPLIGGWREWPGPELSGARGGIW